MLYRLVNLLCFPPIETFFNVSEPKAFKEQFEFTICLVTRGYFCVPATTRRPCRVTISSMFKVTLTFKDSEEDEVGYVVLGHLGNQLDFPPFKMFINASKPDEFRKNWNFF
jgi:hypothetical protein